MNEEDLRRLVRTLASGEHESECVEFKENRAEAEEIGAYLSAISNSAALHQQDVGYIVWGVRDGDHKIVGSTFLPRHASAKVGNEDLEAWLSRMLHPRIDFRIHELEVDGHHVVVFEVPAASHTPVRFRHTEFIRVGSYRKKLRDHPEKE
ncbi:MAG: ATP-binding protein, partial [Planctomycetes bacterium]|nr:ATP-binding protein [Planctomycetota bacterium]